MPARRLFITSDLVMVILVVTLAIGVPLSMGQSPLNWLSILFVGVYAVGWIVSLITRTLRRRSSEE
jgi:hypothetical protein